VRMIGEQCRHVASAAPQRRGVPSCARLLLLPRAFGFSPQQLG